MAELQTRPVRASLSSRATLWLLAALLPFTILALWQLRAPIDLSIGDQSQYLLHAQSLLEARGYTDNGYIYYPRVTVSPLAYPPGLPVLIAIVKGLSGSLAAVRLVMVLIAVGFFYVAGRYLTTLDEARLGPATILVCALIPRLPRFATGLYTDLAFALLVWGCCLLIDRGTAWSRRRLAAITALGAMAITFRTVGVALIPALVVHQTWRSWKHREPWTRALLPLVVWLTTYILIDRFLAVTSGYTQQMRVVHQRATEAPTALRLLSAVAARILAYRDVVSGVHYVLPWPVVNSAWHLIALAALVAGSIVWVRRAGIRFLFCFSAFYAAALLSLPWAINRLLWPLMPVIWFGTLEGLRLGYRLMTPDDARARKVATATGLVVAVVSTRTPASGPMVGIGDLPEGRDLYRRLGSVAARESVRAVFFNPRDLARIPRVAAMSLPDGPTDSLTSELRKFHINYAITGSLGTYPADTSLTRAVQERPDVFQPVFGNDSFRVYRVLPPVAVDSARQSSVASHR